MRSVISGILFSEKTPPRNLKNGVIEWVVYTGPKCRLCRREGMKLLFEGRPLRIRKNARSRDAIIRPVT